MLNLSGKIKKVLILVLILAVPGFLYYLLNAKGKNRYKPLPFYGPKIVAKTGHKFHGHYIPDTIYHKLSDFHLTDQEGQPVSFKTFEHKIFIVSFFYSRCPSVCSEVNKHLDSLVSAYVKNRMVKFISITVDPQHDSPAVLKEYAARYKRPAAKWLFATGDTATIYNLARKGFLVNAAQAGKDFVYDNSLILIDQEKRIRGYYTGTSPVQVSRLNDEIKVQIAEELRKIKAPDM